MDKMRLPARSRIKRLAKQALAGWCGLMGGGLVGGLVGGGPFRRPRPPGVLILAYHKVGSPVPGEMNVPLPVFRRQMAHLATHYPVLPLAAALQLAGTGALERDVAVLTFDDGYRNLFTQALPVLQEWNLPATVYICPAYAQRGSPLPWDREPSERVMDWPLLRELTRDGRIRCGSHTWSHRVLPGATAAEVAAEVGGACAEIEDRLGVPVPDFCYPKGLWDARSAAIVRRHHQTAVVGGFRPALPPLDPWRLHRLPMVASDTFPLFLAKLAGRLAWESALSWPRILWYRLRRRWPRC